MKLKEIDQGKISTSKSHLIKSCKKIKRKPN